MCITACVASCVALAARPALAQPPLDVAWDELEVPFTRTADALFGLVLTFDGTHIGVGSRARIDVYRWDGVTATHVATPDPGTGDRTGFGIHGFDLNGDRLIATSSQADAERGAVWFFERDGTGTWVRTLRMAPPLDTIGVGNGVMALSVEIRGARVAMAAPYFGGGFGALALLRADGAGDFSYDPGRYSLHVTGIGNLMGFDVSMEGEYTLVGNLGRGPFEGSGSAVLYQDTGSALVEGLVIPNPNPAAHDQFGIAVDLEADRIYVAARYDDTASRDAGAVYVYDRAGVLQQTLLGTETIGRFGAAFDVDRDWMVVGNPAFIQPGVSEPARIGSVVFFRRDAAGVWQRRGEYVMPGLEAGAELGHVIRLFGNVAVIAAARAPVAGANDAGRVWTAVLTEPNGGACLDDGECTNGHCVQGVCCDRACDGVCEACVLADTGVASGTCASVMDGTDPANECAAVGCGLGLCEGGACELEVGCDAGVPDAGFDAGAVASDGGGVDAGAVETDAGGVDSGGPGVDAGRRDAGLRRDAGSTPVDDAGALADATSGADAGGVARVPLSCTCRVGAGVPSPSALGLSVAVFAVALRARRRRGR